MKRFLFMMLFVLAAVPAFAQNPCTTASSNEVLPVNGTNRFFAELPDHATVRPDGTPVVASYQFAAWLESASTSQPPAQGPTTIPRSAFTAVPTFTNCYELTGGLPGLVPQQARMVAGLRAQSQPGAPAPFSGWAVSNSFSLASPSTTPAAPGQIRIRP